MGKKKKLEPSLPSKAYLVSFGDTMTALLAFFIVLNSLAKEQTGAAMYSGTGSFAKAFSSSGASGGNSGNRSRDMLQQKEQKPIYALAENLQQNDGRIGPDDSESIDRIIDRDKEQFQKFLEAIEQEFGLKNHKPLLNQTVFDSFSSLTDKSTGALNTHAIQLLSESVSKLRQPNISLEVIIWAEMPDQISLEKNLDNSLRLRADVEKLFWLKPQEKERIRYRVKPWLFADAKRPVLSVVVSDVGSSD